MLDILTDTRQYSTVLGRQYSKRRTQHGFSATSPLRFFVSVTIALMRLVLAMLLARATAFQLLPLGSTDGGRIAQSAYGRGVLALASLLTYGFLAFGIIGGTLSLQYGLLALLWARSPSRNILNDASEISSGRQAVATSLLVFALLTLLPNIPPETFNAVVD